MIPWEWLFGFVVMNLLLYVWISMHSISWQVAKTSDIATSCLSRISFEHMDDVFSISKCYRFIILCPSWLFVCWRVCLSICSWCLISCLIDADVVLYVNHVCLCVCVCVYELVADVLFHVWLLLMFIVCLLFVWIFNQDSVLIFRSVC